MKNSATTFVDTFGLQVRVSPPAGDSQAWWVQDPNDLSDINNEMNHAPEIPDPNHPIFGATPCPQSMLGPGFHMLRFYNGFGETDVPVYVAPTTVPFVPQAGYPSNYPYRGANQPPESVRSAE